MASGPKASTALNIARPPIFILGCQRSGTTLLGLLLNAHPQITLIDEDDRNFHFQEEISYLLDLERVMSAISAVDTCLAFKAPRDTHRFHDLFSLVPNARSIWLSRPVEQVVASMCNLRIEAASWALTHAHREIRKYLDSFSHDRAVESLFSDLRSLENSRTKEVALAALCWLTKEKCREQAEASFCNLVYRLNYVELVEEPKKATMKLFHFLNMEWHPDLLRHHKTQGGVRIGNTEADREIDVSSVFKWSQSLSKIDLAVIRETLHRAAT